MNATTPSSTRSHTQELIVLALIGGGLIVILLAIIAGLFGWFKARANVALPNWAENVLVSIATAAALKLGDVLAALVALATGRQLEAVSTQLGDSQPIKPPAPSLPGDKAGAAAAGAQQATDAAGAVADDLAEHATQNEGTDQ